MRVQTTCPPWATAITARGPIDLGAEPVTLAFGGLAHVHAHAHA